MSRQNRSARPALVARFARQLRALRLGEGPVLVAVSGGVDSVVLLDLLRRMGPACGLRCIVAHVDHGIHPESATVRTMVESLASAAEWPCVATALRLGPGTSESKARVARYAWLRAEARRHGARWILTAHHADDQRETVLLRLLRGSAPAGIAGMAGRSRGIARPLLPFSRDTLLRYARARRLRWWEDPANGDPRHLRSWLRTLALPALTERLPDLPRRLSAAARHAGRDRKAWAQAVALWPGLWAGERHGARALNWPMLRELPPALRVALSRAWLRRAGCPAGPVRLRRALEALAGAPSGAIADLGGGWRLELAFGSLRILAPAAARNPTEPVALGPGEGDASWGAWQVRWTLEFAPPRQPRDGGTAWFIPSALALRAWRAGDRLAPLGGRGRRLAVRCFQEAGVPASERAAWPLVEAGGTLAWIPGVCRGEVLVPAAGEESVRIDVQRA